MEILSNLAFGLQVAGTPANILYCFLGALLGTFIGVLPGLGPLATIAMLLPLTFSLPPTGALIMLAGIYYGAQYGGSTTAILCRLPGESSAVMTAIDGYQMARQGRAGPALAIAALGSFFAGCVATLVIAVAAPPLSALGQRFGAPEYFALMVLGLVAAVVIAHGSVLRAILMILVGLVLGLVGTDVDSGIKRLTFGIPSLADGLDIAPVAMGLFGIAEIIRNLEARVSRNEIEQEIKGLMPTRQDLKQASPAVLRGTLLGSILGILPGGGALLSSFAAYVLEKRISRHPERFGRGAIEGVAAPESANNAGAQTSFIPMLTLGIPSNPIMALMMGALMIHGVQPGPGVMTKQPDIFWGVIVSMWLGNLMLLVINLPMIRVWVWILRIPYAVLFPAILLLCSIGVYTVNNSTLDVGVMLLFGVVGYLLTKFGCEPAPLLLGIILGPLMEENLRRALTISRGDPLIFLQHPISAGLLALSALLLVSVLLPSIRAKRDVVFEEDAT
jgi:putative tricarboxylic transport membrane protein